MKKMLIACLSALALALALGPATASAAPPPTTVVCLGAAQSDGSFEPQQVNTGALPEVGLGLSYELCLVLNAEALGDFVNNLVDGVSGVEPPDQIDVPSEEDLLELIDTISAIDPSNPLAVLMLVDAVCGQVGTDMCNLVLGNVLTAPIPLGSATLDGQSGNCFQGQQSGTGQVFGGGSDFLQLDWTADYEEGANLVGVLSGTATAGFGQNASEHPIQGLIGPGCGAGGKVLIMQIG